MKLLSIILQNKKGENMLIVTSNGLSLVTAIDYSHMICQFIIDSYKCNLRVERSLPLTTEHYSVSNIAKEYVLNIIVSKNDLMLAYDGLRKLTEYFNKTVRIQNVAKRTVELFGIFEEFLYCRELPWGQVSMSFKPQRVSRKRRVDHQILNRFSHIYLEPEKASILQCRVRQARLEEVEHKLKSEIVRNSKDFCIKIFEEDYINTDQTKESFLVNYKNRLFSNAYTTRKPPPILLPANQQQFPKPSFILDKKPVQNKEKAASSIDIALILGSKKASTSTKTTELIEEDKVQSTPQRQQSTVAPTQKTSEPQTSFFDVFNTMPSSPRQAIFDTTPHFNNSAICKVRMNEKLQLVLVDQKVKNVHQYGQVMVEANSPDKFSIMLVSDAWLNKSHTTTRITPETFKTREIMPNVYQVQVEQAGKSKAVIDYVLKKETFNYDKIPLMFISSFQTRKNSKENIIEFTFKYKVNDKWKGTLRDIDIYIVLDQYTIFSDCKTNPLANSLKGKTVNWKAKELTEKAKGKLSLALFDPTVHPKDIIKQIRLSMRAQKSLIPDMDVECCSMGAATRNRAVKSLVIQYKILPK